MQQLETGHGIPIRMVRANPGSGDDVTVIAGLGSAPDIKEAAFPGFAADADGSSNAQKGRFACALFDRYTAEESQSVPAHVVEPVFALDWFRDPLRVFAPGKGLGRLPHPWQASGSWANPQAVVKRL